MIKQEVLILKEHISELSLENYEHLKENKELMNIIKDLQLRIAIMWCIIITQFLILSIILIKQ